MTGEPTYPRMTWAANHSHTCNLCDPVKNPKDGCNCGAELIDLIRSEMMSDEHPVSEWEVAFAEKIKALPMFTPPSASPPPTTTPVDDAQERNYAIECRTEKQRQDQIEAIIRETPSGQAMDEIIWNALKQQCCVDPDKATRCIMVDGSHVRAALTTAIPLIQAQERARIVTWLHTIGPDRTDDQVFARQIADAIEQESHNG